MKAVFPSLHRYRHQQPPLQKFLLASMTQSQTLSEFSGVIYMVIRLFIHLRPLSQKSSIPRIMNTLVMLRNDPGGPFLDHDPTVETYHWMPYEEYWQARDSALPERIYSELYNSDAFIQESSQLQQAAGSEECVIMGIMVWSDGTHLANFGNASLWPIYIYFGNQSKYYRSQTAAFAAHHLAYIPKV